ncbi:PREDICTED: probable serine/threonine-protein kinase clkA [Ceratosolen solmsi marchali]|uniref:Probable serine/threonine-protein kinase clkA n=1 Tax=Ceratosolen solmsi marchali TaxID=326594 RepID=A0AAJ6VLR2_9HYME|nr:PREDICTED: probable serine/threonine-protein kinase clkA [Ceratosolen solmsi marchali]
MCDYRQLDTANIVRNFDNEEVKQLLKSIGPVRRKLVLKKIKKYLRNIGLGKENVRKGIIQIMTRPQIVIAKTQTYNPRYEKENHVIENGTEAEGCDFDQILSTKSSHSNSNDDERITLHEEYPLNEPYNIESAIVFNNFLSKPVIENAAKSTIQNLQLDLVAPDSTEEIPSIKQNLLCSTISNSNHNELSNNIFNNQKIKKRNSLSEATTPQPYKCAKRFRSKSSDLSTNKKDSKSILSIKLTLIRDKSNQKNWINLENIKTIAGTDKNIGNVRRNECSNVIEENEITPLQNMCVLPTEIVSEEVPELERYNFENRSIVRNINNFNNCLSPYLRNFVKKRSSSLRDVINMDSDCDSLCKRRKFSDYSTIDMQKNNINNCIDLVKSSLENNLHVKESLLQSKLSNDYSKKLLPKMDPCILNPYNFLNNNDNNKNISVDQNVHANITLSLSSPLKKIVSASLFASNQNEFLDLSQDNYLASGRKYMDSMTEDFSDLNRREEVMTETDNNHIKVTLLKEYMKQVRSNNTDKELHDNDRSSINLKLNMGKESNGVNKITGETENKLKCNINSLENKNMTINLKKIDVHEMENNTSVIDIETIGMEKNQDRSNTNSPDSQEMCIIDIVDSPLNRDQVLPDSTGLDEHLEGGDFDFATSIKKIKQNSDSDNEYDVDSDCDVEINDQESIEYSINMESRDDNVNLINKMTVETNAPKTDDD